MNMDRESLVELFKGTINLPSTLYDCNQFSAIHSRSMLSASLPYVPSSVPTTVPTNLPSSMPSEFPSALSSDVFSITHSFSTSASVSTSMFGSMISSTPVFSGFEFNPICDEPVSGLFRIRLSGYEEKCSYFSADGSVNQLDIKFEVSALEITDMDIDTRGLFVCLFI